jgi:hypothetical protein
MNTSIILPNCGEVVKLKFVGLSQDIHVLTDFILKTTSSLKSQVLALDLPSLVNLALPELETYLDLAAASAYD